MQALNAGKKIKAKTINQAGSRNLALGAIWFLPNCCDYIF
jgi:hypothetical protein